MSGVPRRADESLKLATASVGGVAVANGSAATGGGPVEDQDCVPDTYPRRGGIHREAGRRAEDAEATTGRHGGGHQEAGRRAEGTEVATGRQGGQYTIQHVPDRPATLNDIVIIVVGHPTFLSWVVSCRYRSCLA
ncbi:hypothetical protein GUJ93_ZPchr0012g20905 [Zizania palustris]|uniref:Uncharacterized protein n=1 Tax=Zizania palustris TaxID=103762 RepID=A0A8J6BYP4_ZIZPA|nr:hypothetical protein GUJ93_ZPchr0012g20905 [Zizania palustris]